MSTPFTAQDYISIDASSSTPSLSADTLSDVSGSPPPTSPLPRSSQASIDKASPSIPKPKQSSVRFVHPGSFEPERHFYPRVLNASIHPLVSSFFSLGNERILARYTHLNPQVDKARLREILETRPEWFRWAGSDLLNVTTSTGRRQMLLIETNSCPSGQKSMPLLSELPSPASSTPHTDHHEFGGYSTVISQTFRDLIAKTDPSTGALAVVFDKNPMEASGYAAVMAEVFNEPVWLVEWYPNTGWKVEKFGGEDLDEVESQEVDEHGECISWREGIMHVRGGSGVWHPIRAVFRYLTQKPWSLLPLQSRTLILNPILACLAGGRNKMMAARAYDFFNAELAGSGLAVRVPETIRNVTKSEVPLWVQSMGGVGVVKVPYSNAGQGVYTITSPGELANFMTTPHYYDKFIVQSLVGNASWSSLAHVSGPGATGKERYYHVGTIPDKKLQTYVCDLRVMICATKTGFRPVALYARRARKPLLQDLTSDPTVTSWQMLGTNLSIKTAHGWDTEASRLVLMDRKDFNQLGIGVDDLIDAYIQTVLSVVAVERMGARLMKPNTTTPVDPLYPWYNEKVFDFELFEALNPDKALLAEIQH
ncbi:hypothetical protein BC832DRAFT_621960 [Gaertneriomyces semiglobifer]|nr:hypothetical protein BC832DRAFT_621960 [Gaertneriomyces semiglobifer]